MLYKINGKDDRFIVIKTCAKIKAKEPARYTLDLINIEKDKAEATNGHIGVRAKLKSNIKPGFYAVIKETPTTVWILDVKDIEERKGFIPKFPDMDKVFSIKCCKKDFEFTRTGAPGMISELLCRIFDSSQVLLNMDYLSMLPKLGYSVYTEVEVDGRKKVVFESEKLSIVIMSMRKSWGDK